MQYTSEELLASEGEIEDYRAFMQRVTFAPKGTRVQAFLDGEPFTTELGGPYWDRDGYHDAPSNIAEVTFESEEIALNFFAAFTIGLASSQEAESWRPLHMATEEERKEALQ